MALTLKRRVWIGFLAVIAGAGGWVTWIRSIPVTATTVIQTPKPFVQLAGAGNATRDRVLREKAELLDPTPLFFPTDWNYGQRPLRPDSQRQPGQVFGSFEPKLTVGEQNITAYGAETIAVPEKLVDVLVQGNEAPYAGMGQINAQRTTLSVRSAFIEVRMIGGKDSVISQQLSGINPPRTDYVPLEFLVVVGSAGLVGELILTSGSGWDEVDSFFRAYLVKSYRLGERLPPGHYRVWVGA